MLSPSNPSPCRTMQPQTHNIHCCSINLSTQTTYHVQTLPPNTCQISPGQIQRQKSFPLSLGRGVQQSFFGPIGAFFQYQRRLQSYYKIDTPYCILFLDVPAGCTTKNGTSCIFPFTYNDVTYTKCTTVDSSAGAWCSLNVDAFGVQADGNFGVVKDYCSASCLIQ